MDIFWTRKETNSVLDNAMASMGWALKHIIKFLFSTEPLYKYHQVDSQIPAPVFTTGLILILLFFLGVILLTVYALTKKYLTASVDETPLKRSNSQAKDDKKENKRRSCVTIVTNGNERDETSVYSPDKGDKKEIKRRNCVTIVTDGNERDETSVHSPDFIHKRHVETQIMKLYQLHKADLDSTEEFEVDALLQDITGNGALPDMQGNDVRALLHIMEIRVKKQMGEVECPNPDHLNNIDLEQKTTIETSTMNPKQDMEETQEKVEIKEGKKDERNMWASFKLEEGQQSWGLKVYKPEDRKPQQKPKGFPASGKRSPSPRQGPDYCALRGSYM